MKAKAEMSKVKFQVRYNALMLDQFTVEKMVRATGLNPESVRTELQRLRQEGLLTSGPLQEKRPGRGGRPALYKLTPDPEKRLALSRQVESFFPEPPQPTRPTSRHYLVAGRLLDRIATGQYEDDRECEALAQEARERLDFAWYDEGEPQGLIRAYIDRERARLEYLCGNDETAEALFSQVREAFAAAELGDEVAKIDEYLTCISLRRRLMRLRKEAFTPQGLARSALEALQAAPIRSLADRPLVVLLTELLENLAAFTRDQVLAEALEGVVEQWRVEWDRRITVAQAEADAELDKVIRLARVRSESALLRIIAQFFREVEAAGDANDVARLRFAEALEHIVSDPAAHEKLAKTIVRPFRIPEEFDERGLRLPGKPYSRD